jgi:hypothetical protein
MNLYKRWIHILFVTSPNCMNQAVACMLDQTSPHWRITTNRIVIDWNACDTQMKLTSTGTKFSKVLVLHMMPIQFNGGGGGQCRGGWASSCGCTVFVPANFGQKTTYGDKTVQIMGRADKTWAVVHADIVCKWPNWWERCRWGIDPAEGFTRVDIR